MVLEQNQRVCHQVSGLFSKLVLASVQWTDDCIPHGTGISVGTMLQLKDCLISFTGVMNLQHISKMYCAGVDSIEGQVEAGIA